MPRRPGACDANRPIHVGLNPIADALRIVQHATGRVQVHAPSITSVMNRKTLLQNFLCITATLLITSCVVTPDKLFEDGERFHYIGRSNAIDTGWCMVRLAEEIDSNWQPHIKKSGNLEGATEVVVQNIVGTPTAITVAHIRPIANGSDVTLWIHRSPRYGNRTVLRSRFISECLINA